MLGGEVCLRIEIDRIQAGVPKRAADHGHVSTGTHERDSCRMPEGVRADCILQQGGCCLGGAADDLPDQRNNGGKQASRPNALRS